MTIYVELSSDDKLLKIKVSGRLDMNIQGELRKAYKDVEPGLERCIVDLSQTNYIDSGGLSMLLVMKDFLLNRGLKNQVILQKPNETVRRYLAVSKLEDTFTIE